jgi:hypothetical protein
VKRFVVHCEGVRSFDDFIAAVNWGFIRHVGGEWNGNLDAFHDYLSWPEDDEYEFEITASRHCAAVLGHDATAAWLRDHLATCHPTGVAHMRARLTSAERSEGETLFEIICEIITENSHVHLVLG